MPSTIWSKTTNIRYKSCNVHLFSDKNLHTELNAVTCSKSKFQKSTGCPKKEEKQVQKILGNNTFWNFQSTVPLSEGEAEKFYMDPQLEPIHCMMLLKLILILHISSAFYCVQSDHHYLCPVCPLFAHSSTLGDYYSVNV